MRWGRLLVGVVLATVVLAGPLAMGTNGQLKAGVVVVFAIIGTSVVVLTGWAGQVSLGQMVFVGAGGTIAAWCTMSAGGTRSSPWRSPGPSVRSSPCSSGCRRCGSGGCTWR